MKYFTPYRWAILIVLLALASWLAWSRRSNAPQEQAEVPEPRQHAPHRVRNSSEEPSSRKEGRTPSVGEGFLKDVRSPLARRYLRFLSPGTRLAADSYARSIVLSAFNQSWGVTARLDLSEEQQDEMAAFLLQDDWLAWTEMEPGRIGKWAEDHLSGKQRDELFAFIEESKSGASNLSEMRMRSKKREYGVETDEAAFKAEMAQSKRIAELLAADTDKLPEEEVEAMRRELKEMMKAPVSGKDGAGPARVADARSDEQAAQFLNVLADRIPMTEAQQLAVYDKLREGSKAPINPYDYQSRTAQRIEADVRVATAWMGGILTEQQYEGYLKHFLAEIEIGRFQPPK